MAEVIRIKSAHDVEVREASGNLTAADTSPEVDTADFLTAAIELNVTALIMADGDDEVDFYIQTKLNGTWIDVANIHFDNGDEPIAAATRVIGIGPKSSGVAVITPSDGALADDATQDVPLGTAVRIKAAVTGATAPTYAYNARITCHG